jgi:hypothetical protein
MNKISDFFWVMWAYFCGKVLQQKEYIIQEDGSYELPTKNVNRIDMLTSWWGLEPTWSGRICNMTDPSVPPNRNICDADDPTLELQLTFRRK